MTRTLELLNIFDNTFYPSFEPDGNDTVEPLILYALVRFLDPSICVELGSWKGYSAVWIAQALKDNANRNKGYLWCVDAFVGVGEGQKQCFLENTTLAGVSHKITLVNKRMEDAVDDVPNEIDLLYVDGAEHETYEDLCAYVPKVKRDGIVLIHDFSVSEEVQKGIFVHGMLDFKPIALPTRQGMWMGVKR
jgi:predicted O-methyltransferase YrrM